MCTLLIDIEIETGSVAANSGAHVPVTCTTGRVIIAATAYVANTTGSGSPKWPIPVVLTDGAPTDTVDLNAEGAGDGHPSTIFYALTTGRLAEL